MGVSLVVQFLAFLRQVLVANYFGLSRDLDAYVMFYSLATWTVFTFSGIFESITVPHLVRKRESDGEEAARLLAVAILRVSFALGLAASLLLLLAAPFIVPVIATGFSPDERVKIVSLGWYFLPWTLVALPYYAVAAALKSTWRFTRVFVAEVVVVLVSIGVFAIWHDNIRTLPLAYAAGYCSGFLLLAFNAGLWCRARGQQSPPVRTLLRNIGELYAANQLSSASGVIDRHIQSFVPPGGVAAISYASQLITSLSSILTFREAFLVPLSQETDRAQKLERLIAGVVLLAVPLAGVVVCFAPEIVYVLFQRGRFDATATVLTSQVLEIGAFGIITGSILMPLLRMFQVVDRIAYTYVMLGCTGVSILVFGYLFVLEFGWGVRGVALAQTASSVTTCALTAYLVSRCGIALRWRRVLGHVMFSSVATVTAYVIAGIAISGLDNGWTRLLAGGPCYCIIVLIFYGLARAHLNDIMFGLKSTDGESI